jgi:hypothetical protein
MAESTKTIISIKKPTPEWANYIFRGVLLSATMLNTAIVSAPGISENIKLSIVYWSGIAVTFIWGLSRILGIEIKDNIAVGERRFFDGPGTDPRDPPPSKP